MEYANETHKKYHESLLHIVKEGKVKPTRAQVSKRLGLDPSSLKKNRKLGIKTWEDNLIEEIEAAKKKYLENKRKKTTKQKKKIYDLEETILKLEKALNESRVRELLLFKKIREMELESESKRITKTTLADLSMNLADWTKS